MDLGVTGWGQVDWIALAQDRNKWKTFAFAAMNFRVPQNTRKLSSGYPNGGSYVVLRVSFLVGCFGWLVRSLVRLVS
jgi:hypothetical protein